MFFGASALTFDMPKGKHSRSHGLNPDHTRRRDERKDAMKSVCGVHTHPFTRLEPFFNAVTPGRRDNTYESFAISRRLGGSALIHANEKRSGMLRSPCLMTFSQQIGGSAWAGFDCTNRFGTPAGREFFALSVQQWLKHAVIKCRRFVLRLPVSMRGYPSL